MTPELNTALDAWLDTPGVKLVAFDFDGTLSPVPPHPSMAQSLFPKREKTLLRRLTKDPRFRVAVISGRCVHDLRHQVGFSEGITFSGNHGFEIHGEDWDYLHPGAAEGMERLADCTQRLKSALMDVTGFDWEEKRLSNAIYFKSAPEETIAKITAIAEPILDAAEGIAWLGNGFVYEIFPDIEWHKGRAAETIARHFDIEPRNILFAGDEVNDEPAFRYLPDAFTVKVGPAKTAARYRISGQHAMAGLLERLGS